MNNGESDNLTLAQVREMCLSKIAADKAAGIISPMVVSVPPEEAKEWRERFIEGLHLNIQQAQC